MKLAICQFCDQVMNYFSAKQAVKEPKTACTNPRCQAHQPSKQA